MGKRKRTRTVDVAVESWNIVRDVVLPGALAGTLGAFAMAVLACAFSGVLNGEPWRPALLVAGLFFRDGTAQGVGAVLLGLLIHFSVAGGMATGFALLLPRRGTAVAALCLGVLYGMGLWTVMTWLMIPFASPPLSHEAPTSMLFLLHLAFGAALGTMPAFRNVLTRADRLRRGLQLLGQGA
ncbi:hypothetical protein D7X55_22885 [Corallococcus sp. AB049A]|uniref:DUF1440 domain-containing protein n=1 Tax=Corallococcus interemptor TaxID=2316720 RepID=A0A3A8QDI9_9BACT|nr:MULTISPECIES: hypothetical protein [Corallococcus]RKH43759.1 hypothetical protein D7Y23_28745 [Corallococcus sp. AB050B]RKH64355.1 hypothetical protein D7X96_25980 [Corallococcus interemptor]RKI61675.1 hypothetical protein D7X55_22885 [Corallococcus sp. AB049A]